MIVFQDNGFKSSTYRNPESHFRSLVSPSSYAYTIYDRFSLGDLQLPSIPFLAGSFEDDFPQLGFGVGVNGDPTPWFLQSVVEEGIVDVKGVGVYLDSYEKNSSQIIFGGIDTSKYKAPMIVYQFNSSSESDLAALTPSEISFETTDTSFSPPTLKAPRTYLLFGEPDIRLPEYLYDKLHDEIYAYELIEGRSNNTVSYIDCYFINYINISLNVQFPGINITLGLKDLVGKVDLRNGEWRWKSTSKLFEGGESCRLFVGLSKGYTDVNVNAPEADIYLGDPFFRAAYVWFDYQNNQTGLAKANQGVEDSRITKMQADGVVATVGEKNATVWHANFSGNQFPSDPQPSAEQDPSVGMNVLAGSIVGGIIIVGAVASLIFWFVLRKQDAPEIPPAPTSGLELEGHAKFEMFARHGNCEVVGNAEHPNELPNEDREGYYRELLASHAFPVELPAGTILRSRSHRNNRNSSSSRDSNV
ncbi:hypothetical protein TWF506_007548 [Arthrobotrys conoides]|uniref:Peptidase A1 domain-containing protein n=1 Tax=Arthrobotrys conoides TaxID=74498 RepID=A0AAN8RNB3_9PEZI